MPPAEPQPRPSPGSGMRTVAGGQARPADDQQAAAPVSRFRVRPMQLEDVDRVGDIEPLCFPLPWPKETYRRDLTSGGVSHYLVCERLGERAEPPLVVGFGGYWLIQDECHISTIAVHPDYRGLGLGELLLASMIREGMAGGARSSTLEVRVSNTPAQSLYAKYEFRVVGRRRRYYRDNNEDALVMSVESLDSASYRARFQRLWTALMLRLGGDSRGGDARP